MAFVAVLSPPSDAMLTTGLYGVHVIALFTQYVWQNTCHCHTAQAADAVLFAWRKLVRLHVTSTL